MNEILDYIPHGRENAISRAELAKVTGMDDRSIREAIAKARDKGEFVLSSSHDKGYWISEDDTEIAEFFGECDRRRRNLSYPEMKRKFYKKTGQRYTIVREHERRIVG